MAKLTFLGATAGVTGSSYLLETDRAKVLLECGLVQGRGEQQEANYQPFPFKARELDAVRCTTSCRSCRSCGIRARLKNQWH